MAGGSFEIGGLVTCSKCGVYGEGMRITADEWEKIKGMAVSDLMTFENERILRVITSNKIIVVQGKTRAVAKCHPDDVAKDLFDINLGLRIAVARLKKKKARRKARFLSREVEGVRRQLKLTISRVAAKTLKAVNELEASVREIDVLMEEVNEKCEKTE